MSLSYSAFIMVNLGSVTGFKSLLTAKIGVNNQGVTKLSFVKKVVKV